MTESFRSRAIEGHALAVEHGKHDGQCEWRPNGFYICNCSVRIRTARGYTVPPGPLLHQNPLCPRCGDEVWHDGDSLTCNQCCVHWPDANGDAEFFDDHGDLTEDLAKWEAKHGGAA